MALYQKFIWTLLLCLPLVAANTSLDLSGEIGKVWSSIGPGPFHSHLEEGPLQGTAGYQVERDESSTYA